jgi:hypothetical protein
MPFTKVGPNKNRSPSGRILTDKQVRAYYATKGFKRKPKKRKPRSMMEAVNQGVRDGSR